ncbi:MAG: ADP-forming succinate--CoA ligase subunit beta [Candidatus Omnitrophica bacterium]|nr:ADP-forming succinate--CoA ligase subunit beta [Candidatus Omnitrophota bacterium]
MNLHEYQAKEIFRQYGIPIPSGKVARTPEEAVAAARALASDKLVVKAQIHAGGRGKGGGIIKVQGQAEVSQAAKKLLGTRLKTPQTGPSGQPIDQVLVEVQTEISKEYYAAIILDRSRAKPCLVFSESGGMEIEEVAKKSPQAIRKITFSPRSGLNHTEVRQFLKETKIDSKDIEALSRILSMLAKIFLEKDASLVEINPLVKKPSGDLLALDAKIRIDDNALELHPELASLHDSRQEDPRETEAKKFGLSYVGLDGNIGCMVNGAGLAMATMDLIKLAGGEPANFLDVGGGASQEKVTAAFRIILTDPKVQAILVNIFGGIMRCDVVAEGILAAVKGLGLKVPLVVRLEGTKVKEGKEILKKSGLKVMSAESLEEAAKKAVSCVHSR